MTISKYYGAWQVTCDTCNEERYPDAHLFMDVVSEIRDLGWLSLRNDDDEWVHMCPACMGEMQDA